MPLSIQNAEGNFMEYTLKFHIDDFINIIYHKVHIYYKENIR